MGGQGAHPMALGSRTSGTTGCLLEGEGGSQQHSLGGGSGRDTPFPSPNLPPVGLRPRGAGRDGVPG